MFGLIGAMSVEIENLMSHLENRIDHTIAMNTYSTGRLFGHDVVLSVCGPGKVNAAICTQIMITEFKPEWIVNLGVAGAGNDTVSIGDMVIATSAVQHDMDTSPLGDPVGFVSKIGLVEIPCDSSLRSLMRCAADKVENMRVFEGVIATGDQFICHSETRQRIHDAFNSLACEMEGAAVAHVCYANGVKCGVLRSISDQANGESTMDYPTFTKLAASHSEQVIEHLLSSIKN